jgi:hypothetical protein
VQRATCELASVCLFAHVLMIVQANMRASERASKRACTRLRLLRGLLEGGLRQGFRGDNVAAVTALQQRRVVDDAVTTVQWHGVMKMARRQSTVDNVAATRGDQNEDIDSNAAMKAKMTTETTVSQRYLRRRSGTSTKTKIQAATATRQHLRRWQLQQRRRQHGGC